MKSRGPGDLFGIRQSGALEFKIADIYQDADILKKVSVTVDNILKEDRDLEMEKYASLKRYVMENAGKFVDFRSI